jgi:hypothetical protein
MTQAKKQQQKEIKHLGINLTKEMKDVYKENCKTFKKNLKKTVED